MGALTLPAWKSFFKKYLNRSAAHLLTEERTPIDPGVTAMLEHFQAPSPSEHDIKVGVPWFLGLACGNFITSCVCAGGHFHVYKGKLEVDRSGGISCHFSNIFDEHGPSLSTSSGLLPWFGETTGWCLSTKNTKKPCKRIRTNTHNECSSMSYSSKGCQRKGATSMSALYMFFFFFGSWWSTWFRQEILPF